jgi:cytochrome c
MVCKLLVSGCLCFILTAFAQAAVLFEEQFSGASLNKPPWTVLHEDNPGGANFWIAGGFLYTRTLQGDLIWGYSGYKNFFVIPNTWGSQDFAVILRVVNFSPYRQYQQIAIFAYDGDNDYVKVGNDYWGTGQHWEIAKEVGGTLVNQSYDKDANNPSFWLKMVKRGKNYTGYYSLDGVTYLKFLTTTYNFGDGSPTYLGFCALQGQNETQTPVTLQVDYFRVESLPTIAPIIGILLNQDNNQQQQ